MSVPRVLPDSSPAVPTSLYRYYDETGTLLYVGITRRRQARNLEHAAAKEWWPYVARQEVSHYGSAEEAQDAERQWIVDYRPPFNKQHNPSHVEIRRAYLSFAGVSAASDETLYEQYSRVKRTLPLRIVQESGSRDFITFVSPPGYLPIVQAAVLLEPAKIRPLGGGRNLGIVSMLGRIGPSLVLRGRLKSSCLSVEGPTAKLKIVQSPKPVVIRVTAIEVGGYEASP